MTPEQPTITQADRDAAASGYFAWCSGNPVIPEKMKSGRADDHSMVQAFARHRIAERDAIVAWLRRRITWDENPKALRFKHADAIEAGEHLK